MNAPTAELLDLPPIYGKPERTLAWEGVERRLEAAKRYWLATVRSDGRPHAVPLDGLWIDAGWWFGGSPEAVKHRNLLQNPNVVLHLEEADRAVIVEGACEIVMPDDDFAQRLSELSGAKYGFGPPPSVYKTGVWRLSPRRVLAWEQYPSDATRFVFA